MNRSKFRLRIILVAGLTTVGLGLGVVAGYAGAASPQPTFGPIPAEAMVAGSRPDLAKIPDYVSVLGQDGEIAGYVSKADLFPDPRLAPTSPEEAVSRSVAQPIPVYDSGRRVIGHWAGQQGFVAS